MKPEDVKYIVVHCSASPPDVKTDIKTIDAWHRARGFLKVGYHFVIKTDGTVQEGRRLDEVGAHVQGFNDRSIGICLIGGVLKDGKTPADNFFAVQKARLADLVARLRLMFPNAEVLGHRDLPNVKKDCPCFDVRKWWDSLKTYKDEN